MTLFLITEYCSGPFYMGWHSYLRDSKGRQQRNADGEWGWIRWRPWCDGLHPAHEVFEALGIHVGTESDNVGGRFAELAKRFPIGRQRVGGKPRGCVTVERDEWGKLTLLAGGAS